MNDNDRLQGKSKHAIEVVISQSLVINRRREILEIGVDLTITACPMEESCLCRALLHAALS